MSRSNDGDRQGASPQLENGYTRIANELLRAVMCINLSAYQTRVFLAIIRLTYGYHKKTAKVRNRDIVLLTGLHRSHASRAIMELVDRRIILKTDNKIALNKDYHTWATETTCSGEQLTKSANKLENQGVKTINGECVADDSESVINFFIDEVFTTKGFKPETGVKDAIAARKRLQTLEFETVKDVIRFYLGNDKSAKQLSLSAALSNDTLNMYHLAKPPVEDPIKRAINKMDLS